MIPLSRAKAEPIAGILSTHRSTLSSPAKVAYTILNTSTSKTATPKRYNFVGVWTFKDKTETPLKWRQARRNGLQNGAALRREPVQEFFRVVIAIARCAPVWAVAVDKNTALAFISAFSRAVRQGVHKKNRIAGFEVY